jgi:outer membrane protein TolC
VLAVLAFSWDVAAQTDRSKLNSPNDLYRLAATQSYALLLRNNDEHLARLTQKAANANLISLKLPINGNLVNNTLLPVNFIPAEIFGGPQGTFKEVTFGQPYISSFSVSPQLDILTPSRWTERNMAKTNVELVSAQSQQVQENLNNELAQLFFAIWSLQHQLEILKNSAQEADNLVLSITERKNKELATIQELNDAKVYAIQQHNEVLRVEQTTSIYNGTLSALFNSHVPLIVSSYTDTVLTDAGNNNVKMNGKLAHLNSLNAQMAYTKVKLEQLPNVSITSNWAWQNNSNSRMLDASQPWIQSRFVGLKLNWDLPVNATRITSLQVARLNCAQAALQEEAAHEKDQAKAEKLNGEYQIARYNVITAKTIAQLENESFYHVNNKCEAGLLDTEDLIKAHRKVVQAKINAVTAMANAFLQREFLNNAK